MRTVAGFDGLRINDQEVVRETMPEAGMEGRSQNNTAIVGILVAILTFLLVQTGGIAYWAGQQSTRQDNAQSQLNQVQQKYEIIQAQFQVITNKLSAMEAQIDNTKNRR